MKRRSLAVATALLLSCNFTYAVQSHSDECEAKTGGAKHLSWLDHLSSKNPKFETLYSLFERIQKRGTTIVSWDAWRDAESQRATFRWGAEGFASASSSDVVVDRYFSSSSRRRFGSFFSRRTGDSYVRQGANGEFFVDFSVAATGARTELRSFDFSALFNNVDAQKNWTLSVESGDVTIGTVARGELSDEGDWERVEVDLSSLADNDLGPGGTATFRLSWWGGEVSEDSSFGTGLDKVALRAAVPVVAEGIRPGLGERADWLRGSWGINWKPTERQNGVVESLTIDGFLNQIQDLRTIDYIQTHLNESHVSSPVHFGPHELLESFWLGDTDADGEPINLVVPRAENGVDPFLEMLKAVKAAGMKNQVYVNSSNLLSRDGPDGSNPGSIPNITERWKEWCDTNPAAQAFIKSKPYHVDGINPERPYMFCYAEFVLRDYAIRYGDLIDGWLFDSGRWMVTNGDNATSGLVEDQRIYEAFALACRAGNPNTAVAYNNSPGERDLIQNPFSPATLYDDYMFGHPFAGGKRIGDHSPTAIGVTRYEMNYSIIEWIAEKLGSAHFEDGPWTWDDKVVGHFDPPMSTSAWNSGGVPALTDEEFKQWNREALMGGGAISWGAPLNNRTGLGESDILVRDWGMHQLSLLDEHLKEVQIPDTINWSRAGTALPEAIVGQAYYHTLVEGIDFWDPQGNPITSLSVLDAETLPSWLSLEKSNTDAGVWILSGIPTEACKTVHLINLSAGNGSISATRFATLPVSTIPLDFEEGAPGVPVWASDRLELEEASVPGFVETFLIQGIDFYDFEGDDLIVSKVSGPDWLSIDLFSSGIWRVSGEPTELDFGSNEIVVSVSDGTNSSEMTVAVFVLPVLREVDLFATPNTNYGVSSTAVMVSDVLSAYDGIATFKLAFDVTPQAGGTISSGASGGLATNQSWGVFSPGEAGNQAAVFNGSAGDAISGIGNLRVVEFNANGGLLTVEDVLDLSFASVSIVNGQSPGKDSVGLSFLGLDHSLGSMGASPFAIDLGELAEDAPVDSFSLFTASTGAKNKWSVDKVTVFFR